MNLFYHQKLSKRIKGASTNKERDIEQPPPVTIFPIFLCLPLFVRGIPIDRDNLDLARVIPTALFQEKPPYPILKPPYSYD
jgi:hypothetical protein